MIFSLYKLLPEPVRRFRHEVKACCKTLYWIIANAFFDTLRFVQFSSVLHKGVSQNNERALLTFYYHRIEKALALPVPRPGFGSSWIAQDFLPILASYTRRHGFDHVALSCQGALRAYVRFHEQLPSNPNETVRAVVAALKEMPPVADCSRGGIEEVDMKNIQSFWNIDFESFANARHSVRNFSQESVSNGVIEKAVQIAQKAPSVCNRQGWHVYALMNRLDIRSALEFQNGNAGFRENIPCLLLVTGDNAAMLFENERNQIWIDAGLFSMALVYALQSLGLASCCLNLCLPFTEEKRLGEFCGIPKKERVVMMIAVGHPPERMLVACSARHPLSSVLTWVKRHHD